MTRPKILYTSFDQVPAPKGASTHILQFVGALGEHVGDVILATPGPQDESIKQVSAGVRQIVLGCADDNPLGRARTFRKKLNCLLRQQVFQVIQFRSIFEGVTAIDPVLNRGSRLVYEANGFPSIEMKYHHPALLDKPDLIQKLRHQENNCLAVADQIITVSNVNRLHIAARLETDVPVTVIANGADLNEFQFKLVGQLADGPIKIVYVGTTSPWQGITTLLEAIELVQKQRPVQLTIVGANSGRRARQVRSTIANLGIESMVKFKQAHSKRDVCQHFHDAQMTVVPLLKLDRNTVQGCCPLKMIEAMASGCPVIASNLPVVNEIATPDVHYLPIKPGDARNLKNVILQMAADNDLCKRLSTKARTHVEESLSWKRANQKLVDVYQRVFAR